MKVGDYVRTKNGSIFKIVDGNEDNWDIDIEYSKLEYIEDNWLELYRYNDNHSFFNDKNIIKSSPNIIDLIEVGDYINGQQVCLIDDEYIVDDEIKTVYFTNKNYSFAMFEEDIKSIVTKEQFSQMEYKVGD